MYISKKERTAILDAIDFIRTNADCATDQTFYDEMCGTLKKIFDKATVDIYKRMKKSMKLTTKLNKTLSGDKK
jgi:hypothetical protein